MAGTVTSDGPSVSQVNKAGQTVRRELRAGASSPQPDERVAEAIEVILAFRAAHATPLVTANNGLRSMVRSEGCEVEVSQRLKRTRTILDKLVREPSLALARMQDIGGCRAVLNSIDEVRRVERRLCHNRPPLRVSDYIGSPRSSGYRGVHVIVKYGGRQIEVQLRTRVMHEWAFTVEKLAGRLSTHLKADGTHPVQLLMSAISRAMAIEETGGMVDADLLTEIATLRTDAEPYLAGGGSG